MTSNKIMNCTPEELSSKINELRTWINTQPQLPQDLDDGMLKRFLHSCYYDLENTKRCTDIFFKTRASVPECFTNRDPQQELMQKTFKITNLGIMPISGNRNLWLWQLNDPGLEKFDYLLDAKLFILSLDAWLIWENMHGHGFEDSDIVLMDMKDISMKVLTKIHLSLARKLAKYQQEALPVRLVQVHLVNAPSIIDKLFHFLKGIINQELVNLIRFHTPNSETLFQYFSKDDLPADFGGNGPTMKRLMEDTIERITILREHLLVPNLWISDESKRQKTKKKVTSVEMITPSLRTLSID